jgi:DNA primase
LKDRVEIPLHDHQGKLIAYTGRVVDDATISEKYPRYRFPSKRKRESKLFEFGKTLFLYNSFRIKAPVDDLIIVERFTSVWWLHQNRLPHVAAIMGSGCSERQAELLVSLVKPSGQIWLMPHSTAIKQRIATKPENDVRNHYCSKFRHIVSCDG